MIINRLRSDDIYGMSRLYSAAEHRSSALASQASLLYVALYFSPKTLHEGKAVMREVVDKHFSDHWVVPLYMGERADLSLEWERYRAAKEALTMEDALTVPHVKALVTATRASLAATSRAIDAALVEGVLSETYVVDNVGPLLETVKAANMALRWVLLHRRCEVKKWRDLVCAKDAGFSEERPLLDFLLRTSQLEYRLKAHVKHLLSVKDAKWAEDKGYTGGVLRELSEYFSGARALTRVERDEGLQSWFAGLAAEVSALDYADGVLAGRKMRQLVRALDEVLQFDIIDATPQVKDYLLLAKERITEMVRSCAISDMTLADLNTLSDFAYAWELIQEFTPEMHARISSDPTAVRPLRATVLKLTSTLDAPIMRITQAGSPDLESVAQYYSNELVGFLRKIMGVIPVIVFVRGILRARPHARGCHGSVYPPPPTHTHTHTHISHLRLRRSSAMPSPSSPPGCGRSR
jgi:WASH complex subunit strumpellin